MGLRVVIPVAGIGTRLRPFTHTVPKALVPVAGRPMLGHILEDLKTYDVEEVTLIVGYYGAKVRDYVTKHFPYDFRFVEQEQMLGLGHAIWLSAPGYRDEDGPLLIILGDTIYEANFDSILGTRENWIGVKSVEDPRRFGVVELEAGRIKAMVEKPTHPPSDLAVVGIYYFHHSMALYEALDYIVANDVRTKGELQLTDALSRMIERGVELKPFEVQGWLDCGKPETLLETNRLLLGLLNRRGSLPTPHFPGSVLIPPVALGPGVSIENSVVGPNVSLGEGCQIRDSRVSDSVMGDCVTVEQAVLRGSILADNVRVAGRALDLNLGDASEHRA